VITLVEIDQMKRSMADLQNVIEFANAILDTAPNPMLVVTENLRVKQVNRAFREKFKISRVDLENARIQKIGDSWKIPQLRGWLLDAVKKMHRTADLRLKHKFPFLGEMQLALHAQRLKADGNHLMVITVKEDAAGESGN
jgi:two-component system CheB/CheR fusion protein